MILDEALKLNDTLNPKLWTEDNQLKTSVYDKLINIYYEFMKFIQIPLNVVDVEIVGSNASYNYNENSDIDLHIIVNNEINYMDDELLQQFYNSKKNSFNENYDIDIDGIPVELYIEDIKSGNATNGRYSIIKNEWLLLPEKKNYNIPDISKELAEYETKCIDAIISDDDECIKTLINEIYMMRKLSLAKDGESGVGNLVFKELRNEGMIDKLKQAYYVIRSRDLSL